MRKIKRKKTLVSVTCVCVIALIAGLVACAPQSSTTGSVESEIMPEEDNYGVVVASEWEGL